MRVCSTDSQSSGVDGDLIIIVGNIVGLEVNIEFNEEDEVVEQVEESEFWRDL